MSSTTGNTTFAAPTDNNRTVGNNSRFAPVTRQDLEALLAPHGFTTINIPGTAELVFGRTVSKDGVTMQLRVLSGCNADGAPRPRGTDAIRTQLWTVGDNPVRVRGAKRTMRVFSWRKNLLRKLKGLCDWFRANAGQPAPVTHLGADNRPATQPAAVRPTAKPADCVCPRCGGPLTNPKQGKRGPFRGCRAFPKCRGLVNV